LIPAALIYKRTVARPGGAGASQQLAVPPGSATAELVVVLVDARLGKVGWRTVAKGDGRDPWTALTAALKKLTPGIP
jgi:hypothetical protein